MPKHGPRMRDIIRIPTGGTIGSGIREDGAREASAEAGDRNLEILKRIPQVRYHDVRVEVGPYSMTRDSSAHPRGHLIQLGKVALQYANNHDGIIVEFGTDTMNLSAATLALMGNEVWTRPVTFAGAMKGSDAVGSDAPRNLITAGIFTAYSKCSGVFAVRPNGVIITSRHDTPGGSIDWHGRGIPQAENAYFARVDLEGLVDEEGRFLNERPQLKGLYQELTGRIKLQRDYEDGTLDYKDQVVVGGRGWIPAVSILGYGRTRIMEFKERPTDDNPRKVLRDMRALIEEMHKKGRVAGSVIPGLALIEHIRRHREKPRYDHDDHLLHEHWKTVLHDYLSEDLRLPHYPVTRIVDFWERHSGKPNLDLDFTGLAAIDGSTDPGWFYHACQAAPPRGVVIRATGASGLRLEELLGESYRPVLKILKDGGVPVVLHASSRGEVTSFEYGPGRELLESDFAFFAGTMDHDLMLPRLALLNAQENRLFLESLVSKLETSQAVQDTIQRNVYRQLLSGSHYRNFKENETPDRDRFETSFGTETRVDLLGSMHVKKAILAALLHETARQEISLPSGYQKPFI
jgi:L-asparaginase/Glu-tRNA(Gln) amidotransferase subunit D